MDPFGKGVFFFVDPFVKGSTPPKLSRQEVLLPSEGSKSKYCPIPCGAWKVFARTDVQYRFHRMGSLVALSPTMLPLSFWDPRPKMITKVSLFWDTARVILSGGKVPPPKARLSCSVYSPPRWYCMAKACKKPSGVELRSSAKRSAGRI